MPNAIGRNDGKIIIVSGKSRSGKSAYTKDELNQYQRCIAWDAKGEYGRLAGWTVVNSLAELVAYCIEKGSKPGKVAYKPKGHEMVPGSPTFDQWARIALEWTKVEPATAVAEELADVSSSGKASPGWGQLVRKGLEYGGDIYAVMQRPAEADKTVFGNASEIVSFMLVRANDKAYMAQEMGTTPDELPAQPLHYYRAMLDENQFEKAVLQFK